MNGNNGEWPKISVVTPSFNQGQYIEATINSVWAGISHLEYIIMDGGSTDGTVEIIEKYPEHLAFWVSENDEGQTDALIKGFDRASGDILCWLCSDDLFEARTLHEVAEVFVRASRLAGGLRRQLLDRRRRPSHPPQKGDPLQPLYLDVRSQLPPAAVHLLAPRYLREGGGLDPRMKLAMDADLWSRFAEHTALHHIPRPGPDALLPGAEEPASARHQRRGGRLIRSRYLPDEPSWLRRLKWFLPKACG